MTEPNKIAFVFLIVMAIGLLALTIEWVREKGRGWLLLIFVSFLLLAMALTVHSARAHDHNNPVNDAWMKALMQPDNPNMSCCGESDHYWCDAYYARDGKAYCRITDDRVIAGRPHIPVGTEIEIPPNKLKWDRGNPTGHNVIFVRGGNWSPHLFTVFCFVQGTLS
jgi:hypothetical protein